MILLVAAPRQRVGGRHRRAPALACTNLVNDRDGLTWQRDTEGHTLRSGVAVRVIEQPVRRRSGEWRYGLIRLERAGGRGRSWRLAGW
jgi:hypothetical protein